MHSTAVHKINCECSKKIEKLIGQNFLNLNQWERQLEIDFRIHFMHFMPKSENKPLLRNVIDLR